MRPECIMLISFILRHCGSVAIEAPSGRATGAQRQFRKKLTPVHLQGNETRFHSNHPAGQAFPPGMCLLRFFNP